MTISPDPLRAIVINLESAVGRRRLMSAQLDWPGMPAHEFFAAIDGRRLDAECRRALYDEAAAMRHDRPLTAEEIGCAASHLAVYRLILERNLPAALVLEDDALLGHQFPQVLASILAMLEASRPQVILLSHVGRYSAWRSQRLDRLHRLCRPYSAFGAHAYVITRAGAQVMLEILQPIHTVADDWRHVMRSGHIDLRAVVPYVVGTIPAARDSQIGDGRFALPRKRSALHRWLYKYLWMKLLFQIVAKPLLRLKKQESSW